MVEEAIGLKGGNILGNFGIDTSSFSIGTIGTVFLWIIIAIIFIVIVLGIVIYFYSRYLYNQKVMIFGKVGGVPMFKRQDAGRFMKMGSAGDRLIHFKKGARYLSVPTIQMGKNIWWYWEREDGELINIGLKDLDNEMKKMGAYFVDSDMRMQRLGIQKNLENRFENKSFFEKYGQMIATTIYVVFVTIALVVLFSKLVDVANSINKMGAEVGEMARVVEQYYMKRVGGLAPSDIVNEGGAGLIPALIPFVFLWRKKWD